MYDFPVNNEPTTEDKIEDTIEKRWAGLMLRQHRDIRFEGNPTEVAFQYCRAVSLIKESLTYAGNRGIDYAQMAQPSSDTGASPDAEYASHVRRLAELERVANEAFATADDRKLWVWSELRLPMTYDSESGWRPGSSREVADKYRENFGQVVTYRTIQNWAKALDRKLDKALEKRGWTI